MDKRRCRIAGVAALSALLVVAGGVSTAQAAPAPRLGPDEAGAATQLERDWGVSREDAELRLARQQRVEDFAAAAAAAFPASFGGAFVDQAHGGRVVVLAAGVMDTSALAQRYGLTALVEQRPAARTLTELVELSDRLGADAATQVAALGPVTVAVDVPGNAVQVRLPSTSPSATARQAFLNSLATLGDAVHVRADRVPMSPMAGCDFWTCPPPLRGGVETDYYATQNGKGYLCSLGFIGTSRATGHDIALSAGHCRSTGLYTSPGPNDLFDLGPTMGYEVGWKNGGTVDAGIIDLESSTTSAYSPDLANYVYQRNQPLYNSDAPTGNETFEITSVATNSNVVTGVYLCKSARTSGFTCGSIDAVNVSDTACDDFGCYSYSGFFTFTACSAGGDSGGPVYDPSAHRAFGLVSYGPTSQHDGCGLNTSGSTGAPTIANVMSALNVTLNTVDGTRLV